MSYTGCQTIFDVRQPRADLHCAAFNDWALTHMAAVPATVPVIIVNRASAYAFGNRYGAHEPQSVIYFDSALRTPDRGYSRFLHEFSRHLTASACRIAATRPVHLLRPIPEMPADVPRSLARAARLGCTLDMVTPLTAYHQRHALVWAAQDKAQADCGAHVLEPLVLPVRQRRLPCHGWHRAALLRRQPLERGRQQAVDTAFQLN